MSWKERLAAMPKVELHAHLNGSISPAALQRLAVRKAERLSQLVAAVPSGDDAAKHRAELDEISAMIEDGATPAKIPLSFRREALLAIPNPTDRMKKCFTVFDAIYKLVDNLAAVRDVVDDVLSSYYAENTLYLELRCTLRPLDGQPASAYLHTILQSISDWESKHLVAGRVMVTRVLVGINRASSVALAEETIDAAVASLRLYRCDVNDRKQFQSLGAVDVPLDFGARVVGLDLCGNCYKGNFTDFLSAIQRARDAGLKITLHAGEKDDEPELLAMLESKPDRLGHLVFAQKSTHDLVGRTLKIPVEMNLTSNFLTTNWGLEDHHLGDWISLQREAIDPPARAAATSSGDRGGEDAVVPWPYSINTDDRGVFDTSLFHEYSLLLETMVLLQSKKGAHNDSGPRGDALRDELLVAEVVPAVRGFLGQAFVARELRNVLCREFDRQVTIVAV